LFVSAYCLPLLYGVIVRNPASGSPASEAKSPKTLFDDRHLFFALTGPFSRSFVSLTGKLLFARTAGELEN